ncbi:hypothetical protein BG004_005348, partial [Podila humilis]
MKILCIGDSLTAGYVDGGLAHTPYSDHLIQLLQDPTVTFVNAGQDGAELSSIQQRLGQLLLGSDHYDIVIFLGGTNDLGTLMLQHDGSTDRLPYATQVAKARMAVSGISFKGVYDMINRSQSTRALIHLTIPYNVFDRLDTQSRNEKTAANELIQLQKQQQQQQQQEQEGKEWMVLDLNDHAQFRFNHLEMTETERELYFQDALHYSRQGYQRLAE